ncbi:hypothetical protein YWIDRAFT_04939 [Streptomyces sp. SceaMP-e96]|nr:hypothetical protein YWIDRAFT_04939 [Streptomyces sp. SceaMP-e96]
MRVATVGVVAGMYEVRLVGQATTPRSAAEDAVEYGDAVRS